MDTSGHDAGFTVARALHDGYTLHDVNTSLAKPFWGIRAETEDFSIPARCRQFLPRLPDGGFYSHTTAAILWGLTLPPWLDGDLRLHVSVPAGRRAVDAQQIIGHEVRAPDPEVRVLDGLPVSSPARLWREVGTLLPLADLVALGDELMRRERPLSSETELASSAFVRGYRGKRNVVAALRLIDDRAESRPESLMRVALVTAGLPRMLVNPDVQRPDGSFLARPDLLFAEYPVAVEYEGDHHRTDTGQWRRDIVRFAELADAGLDAVRATADDLPDFRRLVVRVRSRLRRHGWGRRTADF